MSEDLELEADEIGADIICRIQHLAEVSGCSLRDALDAIIDNVEALIEVEA